MQLIGKSECNLRWYKLQFRGSGLVVTSRRREKINLFSGAMTISSENSGSKFLTKYFLYKIRYDVDVSLRVRHDLHFIKIPYTYNM